MLSQQTINMIYVYWQAGVMLCMIFALWLAYRIIDSKPKYVHFFKEIFFLLILQNFAQIMMYSSFGYEDTLMLN